MFFRSLMATVILTAAVSVLPARATDTMSQLQAAKTRLDAAQAALDKVTAAWQMADSRLAQADDALQAANIDVARAQGELADIQSRLDARARAMFEAGGDGATVNALLDSTSMADLADRIEYASSVQQGDADLATASQVKTAELKQKRAVLAAKAKGQAAAAAAVNADKLQLDARLRELQQTVDSLTTQWRKQQEALGLPGTGPIGTGAVQTCPVAGANSFVDAFGWPRPGGRVHEGIDLIASYGTPIVAVHSGNAVRTPNTLGGNAVTVYHDGGGFTYYAHMSSYGAVGHVTAGQVIGYVGATGDTNVNHLHFEYHPYGGATVDPYQLLLAVC